MWGNYFAGIGRWDYCNDRDGLFLVMASFPANVGTPRGVGFRGRVPGDRGLGLPWSN